MVLSMTGFGKSEVDLENKYLSIEIKTLNSNKGLDISIRVPSIYKELETDIRNKITKKVLRGKVDFSIFIDNKNRKENNKFSVNKELVKEYIKELKEINPNIDNDLCFQMAMKMPEVLEKKEIEVKKEDKDKILNGVDNTLDDLSAFRKNEGKTLEEDLMSNINNIKRLSKDVLFYEDERINKVKSNLEEKLEKLDTNFNKDRLEQELIYYIEKFDINEEKVRLESHINYFIDEIKNEEVSKGKKLNFILQEIGREINTLGSKANHSELQKIVVKMKDSLEKIKEQNLNIL